MGRSGRRFLPFCPASRALCLHGRPGEGLGRSWAPEPRTAEWAHGEASDGRLVLVAVNEDDRPAYIDLEQNGHIDRVFCAPEAAGQGSRRGFMTP